jgi:hypothetical protein
VSLDNKPIESIQESDLQALVDNNVVEWKTIEYKENLPGGSDAQRVEFLSDVSSFANASGGHLIYGIRGRAGVPTDLCGLSISDLDAAILRLESMIRDGIRHRIPGIACQPVALQNGTMAIVLRIPRSWALPHMVTFKGHDRFYSRGSNGKYRLDVDELRTAFVLSGATTERIRNFRTERLSNIVADETPVMLSKGVRVILHIIPIGAVDLVRRFDMSSLDLGRLRPLYGAISRHRHNLDGYLTYDGERGAARSYLQVFRNGIIEAVSASLIGSGGEERWIPSITYETEILQALPRFLSVQQQLGVEPPLFIMLSLLGVAGYVMATETAFWQIEAQPIDRDTLLMPEVMVERFDVDPAEAMKPIFDTIWNACGWPRSMNYNEEGRWAPRH